MPDPNTGKAAAAEAQLLGDVLFDGVVEVGRRHVGRLAASGARVLAVGILAGERREQQFGVGVVCPGASCAGRSALPTTIAGLWRRPASCRRSSSHTRCAVSTWPSCESSSTIVITCAPASAYAPQAQGAGTFQPRPPSRRTAPGTRRENAPRLPSSSS